MMYDSLNDKIKTLSNDVIVYPAHGPGSACGKNIGKETFSTIGEQKKFNYALQDLTRKEFIKKVTDGILPPPNSIVKIGIEEKVENESMLSLIQDFKYIPSDIENRTEAWSYLFQILDEQLKSITHT